MPTVLFRNENVVLVECKYVPSYGQTEIEDAAKITANICNPHCGIFREANLKDYDSKNAGKKGFKLTCIHPTSPFKEGILKKLRETGDF